MLKRKMMVLLLCFSFMIGSMADISTAKADSLRLADIDCTLVNYTNVRNFTDLFANKSIWEEKIISNERISGTEGLDLYVDGVRLGGVIYRRVPRIQYSLYGITNSCTIFLYLYRNGTYKRIASEKVFNEGTYLYYYNMGFGEDFSDLFRKSELKKGKTLKFKLVAKDSDGSKVTKYKSYTIPAKLNRAYVDVYKKGKSKGKNVYFMYSCEGTNCETQFRYKKGDKWSNIPKLCGKLEPVKRVKFKTDKTFYVRCRTWETINGKKVYSKWSWEMKVSPKSDKAYQVNAS